MLINNAGFKQSIIKQKPLQDCGTHYPQAETSIGQDLQDLQNVGFGDEWLTTKMDEFWVTIIRFHLIIHSNFYSIVQQTTTDKQTIHY